MVVRVEYHISKDFFVKHKKELKKLLHKEAFIIAELKFEKGMIELEIAKQTGGSYFKVRKILSFVCERIRRKGYRF